MESVEHYLETRQLHAIADRDNHRRAICYFIGADSGPVKIGATFDIASRLDALQTGSPVRLKVLATTFGGYARERAYHYQFASLRLHGEWFRRGRALGKELRKLGMVSSDDRPPYPQEPREAYSRF